jgi:hypothetical protein
MPLFPLRGLRALLAPACCCLAMAGCQDDVTGPSGRTHPAGGRMWAAVTVPGALPDDRTWLPFLGARKGERSPARERVEALRGKAREHRRAGRLEEALRAEELAAQTAAGALAKTPDRATVGGALEALDAWAAEAEGVLEGARVPELDAALAGVRSARLAADSALAQGDTLAAVGHVARAASAAREQAPAAVALRAFERAEAVVRERGEALPRVQRERVERLLGWARDAVFTGDPERAFRRAVYALQLLEQYAGPAAGGGEGG